MRNKYYAVHLHLDHPERENPWLEVPEPDPQAEPFFDDFDRLLHLSWGPLSAAEHRGPDGRVEAVVDLWALCGFDAAPAVLERLERRAPRLYARLRAGRAAVATAYPALILPLASADDRRAAVRWGLADFRRRFGRPAAGFVPPAGAVDEDTLEALAREGLAFVLLPAAAAARLRRRGDEWLDTAAEALDCSRPYRWRSRKDPALALSVFFSPERFEPHSLFARRPRPPKRSEVALADDPESAGERLAAKLADVLRVNDAAELAHAAFSADWFGARLPSGERALARAMALLEREAPAEPAVHEAFLTLFPPPQEVQVRPASRDCPHGFARWSGDCACRVEGHDGTPSKAPVRWRAPLRAALDGLSASLAAQARAAWAPLARDPAAVVDAAARLAFVPTPEVQRSFLEEVLARHPTPEEAAQALRLAELERWRLKSLSRWGLESADPSGGNAVQVLRCAARALDLARAALGTGKAEALEKTFIEALSLAPSDGTSYSNAAAVYLKLAAPGRTGPGRVAAYAAAADHLSHEPGPVPAPPESPAWETRLRPLVRRSLRDGRAWRVLSAAGVDVRHRRTLETWSGLAAVRRKDGDDLEARCAPLPEAERPAAAGRLDAAFLTGNADALDAAFDAAFGSESWPLDGLFPSARWLAARSLKERGSPERRKRLEPFARLSRRAALASPAEWATALDALGDALPAEALPGAAACRTAGAR